MLTPWQATTSIRFSHAYPLTDAIERAVAATGAQITDRTFGETVDTEVCVTLSSFPELANRIADLTAGEIVLCPDEVT